MSITRPTIVIVPGAWQLPAGFDLLLEQLRASGTRTEIVPLLSVGGAETPLKGLSDDVTAVRKTVETLANEGQEIVLLCHSYGGVVGSCAVEGLDIVSRGKEGKEGGVLLIVYCTAFVLPKGKSLFDMLGGSPQPWMKIEVSESCISYSSTY
jgi:hypothetical protein